MPVRMINDVSLISKNIMNNVGIFNESVAMNNDFREYIRMNNVFYEYS